MNPIVKLAFGCMATGVLVAFGVFYAGLKSPGILVAIGICAAGLQALFFLVWYLIHTRSRGGDGGSERGQGHTQL
jgi:hypothetical protein